MMVYEVLNAVDAVILKEFARQEYHFTNTYNIVYGEAVHTGYFIYPKGGGTVHWISIETFNTVF